MKAQQEHAAPVKSSMNGNFCVYLCVGVWYDLRMGGVAMYGQARFTKKELDFLLKLRRKPRDWQYLKKLADTDDDGVNIMLSNLSDLYYVVDDKPKTVGLLKLNQKGETIAQAEFDRRFDMYLTRVTALAALLLSVASLIVSVIAL